MQKKNNFYKYKHYSSIALALAAACGLSACSTAKPVMKELPETETEYLTEQETELQTEPQTETEPVDFEHLEAALRLLQLQCDGEYTFAKKLPVYNFPKITAAVTPSGKYNHSSYHFVVPENFAYDFPVIPGTLKFPKELRQFPFPELPLTITVLERRLTDLLETYTGEWSVYVKNLTTNDTLLIHDQPMKSASVMKLFIMGTVYDAIHKGELERTEEITALLNDMIIYSSNEDSNQLLSLLGEGDYEKGIEKVNLYISSHRYEGETHEYNGFNSSETIFDEDHFNQVSAKDCGKLLERIYRRTFASRKVCNEIESMMLSQKTRSKIPSGLPEGTAIGNKTGEMDTVENDVAIIYGDKSDYILCILSSDWEDKKEAISHISELSAKVYEFFNDDAYYLETPDLTAYDYELAEAEPSIGEYHSPEAETAVDRHELLETETASDECNLSETETTSDEYELSETETTADESNDSETSAISDERGRWDVELNSPIQEPFHPQFLFANYTFPESLTTEVSTESSEKNSEISIPELSETETDTDFFMETESDETATIQKAKRGNKS